MQSYNESMGSVEFKSSLELRAFQFCDSNEKIEKWSIEPFAISYRKPTDGLLHRYYIDLLIKFKSGHKFLVEIKSSSETKPPVKPKKVTDKSTKNYMKQIQTWAINSAKWIAAKEFAATNDMKFIFLTEEQLG